MYQAICAHAERAAEKLRAEHQYCKRIGVFVSTSPFAENEIFYKNQASTELAVATQDTRDIIGAALKALEAIFIPGHRYHRDGVVLTDFRSEKVSQLTLFDEYQPLHNGDKLMKLLDKINGSGKAKIWFAGQGIQSAKADWKMRRGKLSPSWTTKYSDLLKVHC